MKGLSSLETSVLLTAKEAAKVAEVPLSTLHEYLRLGYIVPSFPSANGRDPHIYSFQDAVMVRLTKHFSEVGIYRRIIKESSLLRLHALIGKDLDPEQPFRILSTDIFTLQVNVVTLTKQVADNLYRFNIL